MKLVQCDSGVYRLSPQAQHHLVPGAPHSIADYIHQAAENPGVIELAQRLRSGRPKGAAAHESGAGFIFREGLKSAMEEESAARKFTLQLAGRAKNVAPALAEKLPLSGASTLLDVGGGTGIYTIALLRKNPSLRAIIWDRPEVLKVAADFVNANGVGDRVEFRPGDMFASPVPDGADVVLLSNILHDWDIPECEKLLSRCAAALPDGGRLLIHDAFLDDDLGGPLSIAMYSLALYTLTEGRAYSAAEYSRWLTAVGVRPVDVIPTLVHCGVIVGVKRAG
jgi:ubiquinone/menaquinone biosynthesis C-methylase UbiE